MLIELHSLTSHAPANLNRDDLGRPKSALFGGANRARISSQAVKRSIRTSNYLAEQLGSKISTRSRQLPQLIFNQLVEEFPENKQIDDLQLLCEQLSNVLGKPDSKDPLNTRQIVFLTHDEIERAKNHIRDILKSDQKITKSWAKKEFKKNAAENIGLNRVPADGADMALFGRMTTDKANTFTDVDASMQVSHAISTHAVTPETDWFTAVDDFTTSEDERGSGHIGELEFNSAVFYKYFSCNLPLLVENMGGAHETAVDALAAVLDASCRVTPSGKQNTFASHALADAVLLVNREQRIPVSLANAFERPVSGNEGYLNESRNRLATHYADLHRSYGLNDRAAFFCADSEARETLAGMLPEGTEVCATIDELFDWLKAGAAGEVPA